MSPKYDVTPKTRDQQNRLVKALLGTHESDYFYDGESRRVRIKELESGTQTKDETFVWCGSRICQKRSGSTVERNYFEQGFEEGTSDYFYTRDHLGSVREVVASDGTTVASTTSYDPWGGAAGSGSGVTTDVAFAGHFLDRPTNLELTWYRAYDANVARWLSKDPIGLDGGLNAYEYVESDPINKVDELGLQMCPVDPPKSCSPMMNLTETAQAFISRCCDGSINREFPGEYKDKDLRTIQIHKTIGSEGAVKAWKLLNKPQCRGNK